jgi:hypothetical protein
MAMDGSVAKPALKLELMLAAGLTRQPPHSADCCRLAPREYLSWLVMLSAVSLIAAIAANYLHYVWMPLKPAKLSPTIPGVVAACRCACSDGYSGSGLAAVLPWHGCRQHSAAARQPAFSGAGCVPTLLAGFAAFFVPNQFISLDESRGLMENATSQPSAT